MHLDLVVTLGRELAQVGRDAGAEDPVGQDAYEAFVRAGLEEKLTPAGIASLTASEREALRDALAHVFEVPLSQSDVDKAMARVSGHWPATG